VSGGTACLFVEPDDQLFGVRRGVATPVRGTQRVGSSCTASEVCAVAMRGDAVAWCM